MYTQKVQEKILELFNNTPKDVSVFYGEKEKNGIFTGERAIIFGVKKKLPLDQVPTDQVFPKTVEIDGVTYKTDVIEVGEYKALACDNTTISSCGGWCNGYPYCYQLIQQPNDQYQRPLKGGLGISSSKHFNTVGTLGLIAVETTTQAVVGLTNNHVIIGDPFYTSFRNLNHDITNELVDDCFQPVYNVDDPFYKIGRVIRYEPLYPFGQGVNYVDGAIMSIKNDPNIFSITESCKQYGINLSNSFPFATTSEISSMVPNVTQLLSVGRTTGVKVGSPCGLIFTRFGTANINYRFQSSEETASFSNQIFFKRINPDCPYPIIGGDSGSALIANLGGVYKIVGLNFAGSDFEGVANRIDDVSNALNIEPYLGGTKNFIDENSIEVITTPGGSSQKTIVCNGKTFWQVGLSNYSNNC